MAKSDQDVRNEVLELRDELIDNLILVRKAIKADRLHLTDYFDQWGDFRYRPITDPNQSPPRYGSPTEINVEPLVGQLRTTIKSLLDSINLIKKEILPEDDPEGQSARHNEPTQGKAAEEREKRRQELRESYKRGAKDQSDVTFEPPKPENEPTQESRQTMIEDVAIVSQSPKPWRETTPSANPIAVQSAPTIPNVDTEKKVDDTPTTNVSNDKEISPKKANPMQVGLSPALRARLAGIRTKHGLED